MPEVVPKLRLSIIPYIGILTHISACAMARSDIPRDSLPNHTANFACSVKSTTSKTAFLLPLMCGEVTTEMNRFSCKCAIHSSVLSNRFTKLHLIADTDVFESEFLSLISCQSSGSARFGSTMYVFSTPNALTFLTTVPMFLTSFGSSITAIRFLQRNAFILSARSRAEDFFLFVLSVFTNLCLGRLTLS